MTKNIIDDGFTRDATIDPVANLHEGQVFRFRPMLSEEFEEADSAVDRATREGKPRLVAMIAIKWLVVKLTEWSEEIEDPQGGTRPAPITVENVRRLQPRLLRHMYRIVSGTEASDPPSSDNGQDLKGYVDTIGDPQTVELEESVGNSEAVS